MSNVINAEQVATTLVVTPQQFLEHWQGHRNLTRRVIEAFPEAELFNYSIGGMRPFIEMALELIGIAGSGIHGIATNEWSRLDESNDGSHSVSPVPKTKKDLLEKWDEITERINSFWPLIPSQRFQEVVIAFEQYENPVFSTIFYFIDNEIHHRAQAYVYLRSLGIQPPFFWER